MNTHGPRDTVNEVLDLLSQLVSINTVNDPIKGVKPSRDAVEFISEWLNKYGVNSEIIESNGYYSVFGVIGENPKVMFLAHYDTVPVVRDRWSYDPFKLTIIGERAYGRGALDDKSNVTAIMIALRELKEKGVSVVFALTGDEEIGGANGARVVVEKLVREGYSPKYLINGDGAGMQVIIRRRKAFKALIKVGSNEKTVKGHVKTTRFTAHYPIVQRAHAAYFTPGVDTHPLLMASSFVREHRVYVKELRGTFIKSNVIPPEVELVYVEPDPSASEEVVVDIGLTELIKNLLPLSRVVVKTRAYSEYGVSITPNMYESENNMHRVVFDIRAMSIREDVEEAFREAVEELLPNADLKVTTGVGGYLYTSRDSTIVKVFTEVLREHGYKPLLGEGAGASDSRYFVNTIKEIIDFGPRGGGMHGDNEYVLIKDLEALPKIYVKVAEKLSRSM